MKLVVTNEDPTLDEAASAYAYAQFLKVQNEDERAVGSKFGDLTEETEEILENMDEKLSDAQYHLYSADEIVIVSANTMKNISTRIDPNKVVQIIDHKPIEAEDFPNAEIIVDEDVNTASAVIAEKFREEEVEINQESATILKKAIESAEKTEREEELLEWLEEHI